MNKKIVALAVAAAFAIPAAASAQTTLFGQFKYEVGFIDDGNDSNLVHSSRGTRLGIRGAEDLGGGLQGIYRFQSGFANVNQGLTSTSFNLDEEAWVGLQGGFGRLLVGRSDTAVKNASKPFRAFTDTLADTQNRPFGFQRAEGIHYTTPNFGGATVGLTIEPNGNETDVYYAANVIYNQGPLFVSAAVEGTPSDPAAVVPITETQIVNGELQEVVVGERAVATYAVGEIGVDETNWQIGVSWDFGPGDIGVLYQARNDGDDDVITIPVNYKVLPNVNLRAAVQYVDLDGGDDFTSFAVGAQYMLSGRTELFANIWDDDWVGATRGGNVNASDDTHFGVGVRHSF